jgi:hypothetical protein
LICHPNPTGSMSNHKESCINFHDRIKPTSEPFKVKSNPLSKKSKWSLEDKDITVILPSYQLKISVGINKNAILLGIKNPASKEGFTTRYLLPLKIRIYQKQINTLHTITSFQSVG